MPISIEKGERDKYHNYLFGGISYPGMTGVLQKTKSEEDKKGLEEWRKNEKHSEYIMRFAAEIGTQTHQLIEDYLYNRSSQTVHLLAHAHFDKLKLFLDKITNIHGLETYLYSKSLQVAGTADTIAEYNGKLSIIDYKTKRSNQIEEYLHDYFLQTTGYSMMWEEMTGQKINQIVILVSSEKGQLEEFIKDPNDFKEELEQRIQQFNLIQK